jgi:hypothetical protein
MIADDPVRPRTVHAVEHRRFDIGMPPGTASLAVAYARRAAEAASVLTGTAWEVVEPAVLAHLLLPLFVGDAPDIRPPREVPGGGWVHADLLPEDEDLFATLAADEPEADAERLAAIAQECRLPVTPYRAARATWASAPTAALDPGRRIGARDVSVIDMTAMWAGPLCTALLADWGAEVVTVEPAVRPDGLRGAPAQFAALDRGKRRVPWDLREREDREAFEAAVGRADVLVESFSPRVLPNLGYDGATLARLNPRLTVVHIRAFPAGTAEASWVAFGRGVHAASGLGMLGGQPVPALLAYPDPLAGLLAFARILEALTGPRPGEIEVSLAEAIAPLLAVAGQPLGGRDDAAVAWLRDRAGGAAPGPVVVQR